MRPAWLLPVPCLGLLVGLAWGASTEHHRPADCQGCHAMEAHASAWRQGPHGRRVACTECHLPQDGPGQRAFHKAISGAGHATMALFHLEPEVLVCRRDSAGVVQANCLRCHPLKGNLPTERPMPLDAFHGDPTRACSDCHRDTGHRRPRPEASPEA